MGEVEGARLFKRHDHLIMMVVGVVVGFSLVPAPTSLEQACFTEQGWKGTIRMGLNNATYV